MLCFFVPSDQGTKGNRSLGWGYRSVCGAELKQVRYLIPHLDLHLQQSL